MNEYKKHVDEVWNKAFAFQDNLEKAIVLSGAIIVSKWERVDGVKALISGTPTLAKIAKMFYEQQYFVMFHFDYDVMVEGKSYKISDWCSLYWEDGVRCHFERMGYGDEENAHPDIAPEIELEIDQIFYQKRKSLLGNFMGGSLVRFQREEDFCDKLCDRNFNNILRS